MLNLQCKICSCDSSLRESIESALLKHGGQRGIFRHVARQFLNYFDSDLHLLEQSLAKHYRHHLGSDRLESKERALTPDEVEFLERVGKGEVSLEEASAVVARIAFTNLLSGKQEVSFKTWLVAETLKLKNQELENKNRWAADLMTKLFGGKLPPRYCSRCGHDFSILNNQISEDNPQHFIDNEPTYLEGNRKL